MHLLITEKAVRSLSEDERETIMNLATDFRLYKITPILARFVVDDNGKPIPYDEAMEMINESTVDYVTKAIRAMVAIINRIN